MRFLRVLFCILGLLSVTLVHASERQDNMPNFRFAHFSPDAASVDVYSGDGVMLFGAVQFGEMTAWLQMSATVSSIIIVPVGSPADAPLIRLEMFVINSGEWITLALTGLVGADSLRLHALEEDHSELPAGETRLSFFHAAEGIPALDVIANGNTLFQLVAHPETDSNERLDDGFVTVDIIANTYTVRLQESLSAENLLNLGEQDLLPNRHYFIGFIGTSDSYQTIQVSTPLGQQPENIVEVPPEISAGVGYVRVVHLASGSPDIDLYIDGQLSAFQQIGFTTVTDFIALPVGDYTVAPTPAGGSSSDGLTDAETVTLAAGERVSIAAIGTTENDTFRLQIFDEDFSPLDTGLARISVVHALPGESAVNVQFADGTVLLSLLGYPGSQGENDGIAHFELLSDTYALQIVAADDPERVLVDFGEVSIVNGFHYFIALINANPPFVFNYVDVNDE